MASYYRARYYDPTAGRFLTEDPTRFTAGANFYAYADNDSVNLIDPSGLLQVCCGTADIGKTLYKWHLVSSPNDTCHCFLKMSNGDTLGGYQTLGVLHTAKNNPDDKYPKNQPKCTDLPGSECKVRQAFDAYPWLQLYGDNGGLTSNSVPGSLLSVAGINFTFPSCAWGHDIRPNRIHPW